MTRKLYGRIKLQNGYFSDTEIYIDDSGWVYVKASEHWYPPNQVRYIDPEENDAPERT